MKIQKASAVDEACFTIGVFNVVFSTWVLSVYPWNYWIWHCVKNLTLLLIRLERFYRKGWHYFLLDFCYIVNYLSVIYFITCILKANVPQFFFLRRYLNHLGPMLFRVAFAWANGPLALSIAVFKNSLVFHSFDHIAILAVHIGPPLAIWGMRWWFKELELQWPDTFHLGVESTALQSTSEYVTSLWGYPSLLYVLMWTLPYFAIIFVLKQQRIKSKGYVTMYSYYEDSLSGVFDWMKLPPSASSIARPMTYMAIHGSICSISFLFSLLFWHSFVAHTVYLLVLFGICVNNGSSYYFRVRTCLVSCSAAD